MNFPDILSMYIPQIFRNEIHFYGFIFVILKLKGKKIS